MVVLREKVSEWNIMMTLTSKQVKQSGEENGDSLRCIKATHEVPSSDTLPWVRSALRWYICHFDSVRLEGSFKKWRPVFLSVMWDHEALVAAHLPGKSTYLLLIQTYNSCWGLCALLLWHWVSKWWVPSLSQLTKDVFVELCSFVSFQDESKVLRLFVLVYFWWQELLEVVPSLQFIFLAGWRNLSNVQTGSGSECHVRSGAVLIPILLSKLVWVQRRVTCFWSHSVELLQK